MWLKRDNSYITIKVYFIFNNIYLYTLIRLQQIRQLEFEEKYFYFKALSIERIELS